MKNVLMSMVIAAFGVMAVPAPMVFADPSMDDTTGEENSPSDRAYEETAQEVDEEKDRFYLDCMSRGHSSDICYDAAYGSGFYGPEYREYAAHRWALANGEPVPVYPKPDPESYMPSMHSDC